MSIRHLPRWGSEQARDDIERHERSTGRQIEIELKDDEGPSLYLVWIGAAVFVVTMLTSKVVVGSVNWAPVVLITLAAVIDGVIARTMTARRRSDAAIRRPAPRPPNRHQAAHHEVAVPLDRPPASHPITRTRRLTTSRPRPISTPIARVGACPRSNRSLR